MINDGDIFPNIDAAVAAAYTPRYDKQKAQYGLMRDKILKNIGDENFSKLTALIKTFNEESIACFFHEEGGAILDYALSIDSARAFGFLCEMVPLKILQHSIAKNNYHLVKAFIVGEAVGEDYGRVVGEMRPARLEKLLLLLKLDKVGVQNFVKENLHEDYMTGSIKEDFEMASEQFKQSPKPSV